MFDERIVFDLEDKYADIKNNFDEVVLQLRSKTVKTVYAKGILHDVLPYEHELSGYKVNGKIIEKEIIKDNCYRYSYDDKDRVILLENMSSFLGEFHYSTMYFYGVDSITTMYWAGDILYNITLYQTVDGKPIEKYFVSRENYWYGEYVYENGVLTSIDEYHNGTKEQKLFYYKDNGELLKIIRSCANGYKEVRFTSQKIQYKKLEERLYNELIKAFSDFVQNHGEEKLSVMGFVVWTGHGDMTLSASTGALGDKKYFPAEWSFSELVDFELVRQALDEKEAKHVLASAVRAADRAVLSEVFKKIKKEEDFYCTIFEHDEEEIEKKRVNIKKILKDNPYFNIKP